MSKLTILYESQIQTHLLFLKFEKTVQDMVLGMSRMTLCPGQYGPGLHIQIKTTVIGYFIYYFFTFSVSGVWQPSVFCTL